MTSRITPKPLLLCFDDEYNASARVAEAGQFEFAKVERHRFPDGEIKLRLPQSLPENVAIFRNLNSPNEKLVELLLAAQTARLLGAKRVTLVAPYLAYMRQDMAFQPGEAVSQRIIGDFLARLFDAVITVDPHLHRVGTLQKVLPASIVVVLSGAPALADLIASRRSRPLLVGPDEESLQWVAQAAACHGFDHAVCRKRRRGDRSVEVVLPDVELRGRQVVLFDDLVSTGHTVAQAAQMLLIAGAASVDVAVVHALFADAALELIMRAGVGEVWSTDCIEHSSNAVSMATTIAGAVATLRTGA